MRGFRQRSGSFKFGSSDRTMVGFRDRYFGIVCDNNSAQRFQITKAIYFHWPGHAFNLCVIADCSNRSILCCSSSFFGMIRTASHAVITNFNRCSANCICINVVGTFRTIEFIIRDIHQDISVQQSCFKRNGCIVITGNEHGIVHACLCNIALMIQIDLIVYNIHIHRIDVSIRRIQFFRGQIGVLCSSSGAFCIDFGARILNIFRKTGQLDSLGIQEFCLCTIIIYRNQLHIDRNIIYEIISGCIIAVITNIGNSFSI